ncbi:hypothetical protein HCC61_21185 [Streptomyces sp. HNM0575]|uniref:hypothetical protein n=1 Tax=Streptomyces sp. HNM0575 TaxID=2716338 RepID=UPI00145C5B8F|nr:hypothetical protein [Streptomyces sp. HNM0575]NLU75152.1 hypothetical protein [Streptomyces sp. HNM0575]
MAIEIAKGTARQLVREQTHALIQVRSPEVAGATKALEAAVTEIAQLEADPRDGPDPDAEDATGPKCMSNVIPSPSGPMLWLDLGEDLGAMAVRRIPKLIAKALRKAGVSEATVACPQRGGPLDELISWRPEDYPFGSGMVAWAPPGTAVPDSWVDAAMDWLSDLGADDGLWANVAMVQFRLDADAGRRLLRAVIDSRSDGCLLVAGDLRRRVRTVHACAIFDSKLTLAERGPEFGSQDRVDTAEELAGIGRGLAGDVEYAAVDLDVGYDFNGDYQCGKLRSRLFQHWGTEVVDGVFWWQVLGEGHLARMRDTTGCVALTAPGRYEMRCGQAAEWLPDLPSRSQLQQACADKLAHCLDDAVRNPEGGLMLPPLPGEDG